MYDLCKYNNRFGNIPIYNWRILYNKKIVKAPKLNANYEV